MTTPLIRAAAQHSPQIAWGDVATWALLVGALLAALVALRQLRIQQDESARQTRQLERQQADKIDHNWGPAKSVLIISAAPMRVASEDGTAVVVSNNSSRPIRDVTCWIELADGTTLDPGTFGAAVQEGEQSTHAYRLYHPRQGTRVPLIRPQLSYGFLFEFTMPEDEATHPVQRTSHPFIRFTDDAGLSWEIDDDLHLKPLPPARAPWRGLMSPDPL